MVFHAFRVTLCSFFAYPYGLQELEYNFVSEAACICQVFTQAGKEYRAVGF